ncbi:MAG TPA: BatA and WFA domain-containing protein, partial [Isosphaeraceae bacterium]|nr:BatA and WFA domain-containing protein [Isosphaeraceae bacterium]
SSPGAFSMSFAHPTALSWLALLIPIVIFYILKIRLRRVPVSTTLFWNQIFEEKRPRSLLELLRYLLSLMVQVALLALLAFALAEPFFRWEVLGARRLVLVIDNSASMNATDLAPSRLAQAKAAGRRIISALRFRDEMAIIAAGTQPQVHCGLTGHERSLQQALEAVPPTGGPTRMIEAVALARRLLAQTKNHKIILLTDGCFPEAKELLASADVEALEIGKKTANVGLTRFQVRRSLIDPIGYEVLTEVANLAEDAVDCRLEIDLNGNVVDVVPLKLTPGGTWSHVFEKTSADGGRLRARLNRPDALAADNEAWAILPRREVRPLALVTEGNLFLEKVLQAIPLLNVTKSAEVPRAAGAAVVTVLHRKVPEKLPAGALFVIEPEGSCDLWELGEKLENPIITQQDRASPLMAHVRLDNVMMPEARQLKPKAKAQVLATAISGDPLFLAIDRPEGKVLVLTVNLSKSDLPLQTAFPIMIANGLNWFSGNKGELLESVSTGAVADFELPAIAASKTNPGTTAPRALVLRSPDGRTRLLPEGSSKVTLGPFDQCGVWTVERAVLPGVSKTLEAEPSPPLLEVACNLASRQESDLRPAEALVWATHATDSGYGGRPIWFYLLAMALGVATLEWFLYQRRWIS